MVELEINGQIIAVAKGSTVMQAADAQGIYIPRLCYHPELSNIAACRLCLVEIIGQPRLVTACSTIVQPAMQVLTNSAAVLVAQRAILELMLINHPLDCPICDKSGQCALQDVVMYCGIDSSAYNESKRNTAVKQLSPHIKIEMNRCIYCLKCVRFCKEIANNHALVAQQRGENTVITSIATTKITHEIASRLIALCPVGALLAVAPATNINDQKDN